MAQAVGAEAVKEAAMNPWPGFSGVLWYRNTSMISLQRTGSSAQCHPTKAVLGASSDGVKRFTAEPAAGFTDRHPLGGRFKRYVSCWCSFLSM